MGADAEPNYLKEFQAKLDALEASWKSAKRTWPYRISFCAWIAGALLVVPINIALHVIYGAGDAHAGLSSLFGCLLLMQNAIFDLRLTFKRKRDLKKLRWEVETVELLHKELIRFFAPETYAKLQRRAELAKILDKKPEGKKE